MEQKGGKSHSNGCLVPRASCLMPVLVVPRASWLVPRASCLVLRASCLVPHARACLASCLVPRASWLVSRASCLVARATCLMPALVLPRASACLALRDHNDNVGDDDANAWRLMLGAGWAMMDAAGGDDGDDDNELRRATPRSGEHILHT